MIFHFISWLLFGLILGAMFGFFTEREDGHTLEYLARGAGGAIVGGLLGMFLGQWLPEVRLEANGYQFLTLIFALLFALGAIFIDRRTTRRGRPFFRDARPDVP
jgi:uncharacterized membrane protein YeaQ/YmgE (transglycosylase-associated protein family)